MGTDQGKDFVEKENRIQENPHSLKISTSDKKGGKTHAHARHSKITRREGSAEN